MGCRALPLLASLILLLSLLIVSDAKEEGSPLAVFFDGPTPRYLRSNQMESMGSMSMDEISASISVLLGFEPSSSLPVSSALKLDEILLPNPFDRPRAVFLVQVDGIKDPLFSEAPAKSVGENFFISKVVGARKSVIQLPGEDEVSVIPIVEHIEDGCDASCIDNKLNVLAHWFGGSYSGSVEKLDGKLMVPLAGGATLNLQLSRKSVEKFSLGLVSLVRGIRKAIETHDDFSEMSVNPSELILSRITGFKDLQEDGLEDVSHQCMQLLQATIVKLFDSLQASYEGKIVGVILYGKDSNSDAEAMLDFAFSAGASRLLEEAVAFNSTSADVLLVRRSLAWITGIILVVSTLIGICLLMNMLLSKDTLLYSNVKLD